MVRTQIMLDEMQMESVRRLAHVHRISLAEAVRRLVQKGLEMGLGPGADKAGACGLLAIAGLAGGGPADLGSNHDKYLEEEFSK